MSRDQLPESYSQWVRRAVARTRGSGTAISLFDSSVPEPVELLRQVVADGFKEPITDRYASAFAAGNPFVVEYLTKAYDVPRTHVLCTTGATNGLALLYRALTGPGDRILVESPGFDLFSDLAAFNSRGVDYFERNPNDYSLDLEAIEAAIGPKTKLVVISNLHNPTSTLTPVSVLRELAELAERNDLFVVVDEVYADYVDKSARDTYAAALSRRLITVSSLTKIYGLGTLRCGWIVADSTILAPVRLLVERTEFGVSTLAHSVAALVIDHRDRFEAYWRGVMADARPIAEGFFTKWSNEGLIVGNLPDYGCIAFPRLLGIPSTIDFANWLAERHALIVAPGDHFGQPGHVRIGFGKKPEELNAGLEILGNALRNFDQAELAPGFVAAF